MKMNTFKISAAAVLLFASSNVLAASVSLASTAVSSVTGNADAEISILHGANLEPIDPLWTIDIEHKSDSIMPGAQLGQENQHFSRIAAL